MYAIEINRWRGNKKSATDEREWKDFWFPIKLFSLFSFPEKLQLTLSHLGMVSDQTSVIQGSLNSTEMEVETR